MHRAGAEQAWSGHGHGNIRSHVGSILAWMSDSDIAPELPDGRVVARPVRMPAAPLLEGALCVFAIIASQAGRWSERYRRHDTPLETGDGEEVLLGLVLGPAWRLAELQSPTMDYNHTELRGCAAARCGAAAHLGFIEYHVCEVALLAAPIRLDADDVAPGQILRRAQGHAAELRRFDQGEARLDEPNANMEDILRTWRPRARDTVVVRLAPALAWYVVRGMTHVMHVVAVGRRIPRTLLLNPREPSVARIKAWLASLPAEDADEAVEYVQIIRRSPHPGVKQADLICDWLDASRFVKDQKTRWQAARAFARIVGRTSQDSWQALVGNIDTVNRETLRAARARLDTVCMLLHRRVNAILGRWATQQWDSHLHIR